MSKTVLITGGMGYLGGRIAVEIARVPGWQVRLASRRQLVSPPEWLPLAKTVRLDVMEPDTFPAALEGVQAVVHLAAVNEIESAADPGRALAVNTAGTRHLLEAAAKAGVKRFIYFSTAHIYGAPLTGHISEMTLPHPVHPYAITHYAAEHFVSATHRQGSIDGLVVRLSNGYGAPTHPHVDRWTLLVNDLCRQAVTDRRMILRSSGLQKRDFVALQDVGRATCHLLGLSRTECGDGVFNLGGDQALSVWDMTQRIVRCCQETLNVIPEVVRPQPAPGETVADLYYDSSKLQKTGFSLRGDMDEEIRQTLRLCQQAFPGTLA